MKVKFKCGHFFDLWFKMCLKHLTYGALLLGDAAHYATWLTGSCCWVQSSISKVYPSHVTRRGRGACGSKLPIWTKVFAQCCCFCAFVKLKTIGTLKMAKTGSICKSFTPCRAWQMVAISSIAKILSSLWVSIGKQGPIACLVSVHHRILILRRLPGPSATSLVPQCCRLVCFQTAEAVTELLWGYFLFFLKAYLCYFKLFIGVFVYLCTDTHAGAFVGQRYPWSRRCGCLWADWCWSW